MYEDINNVLEQVKEYLGDRFGEFFSMSRDPRNEFALYESDSYSFELTASFVQARTQEDFSVSITDRLDEVLNGENLKAQRKYRLASKIVDKPMPIEYFVESL